MEKLDTREWLLTNGLGSFASGTVSGAHTRTYHGWLIAAIEPPNQRTLLLSHIDASLTVGMYHIDLGTNYWGSGEVGPEGYRWLQSFCASPVPTWIWSKNTWQLSRQILLPHWTSTVGFEAGLAADGNEVSPREPNLRETSLDDISVASIAANTTNTTEESSLPQTQPLSETLYGCHRTLIHYHYSGDMPALLTLRPLIGDRHFHHPQRASSQLQFSQLVAHKQLLLQAIRSQWCGTPWHLRWTKGDYFPEGVWYWDYCYPEETRRGLEDGEDLYSPGYLKIPLCPGQTVTLEAKVGWSEFTESPLTDTTFAEAVATERDRFRQEGLPWLDSNHYSDGGFGCTLSNGDRSSRSNPSNHSNRNNHDDHSNHDNRIIQLRYSLLHAGEQFITHRLSTSGPTIMAGYPWLGDWSRNTLIAIPGLTLTTHRFSVARKLIRSFSQYCVQGLMPDAPPVKGHQPSYNNLDISLWWIETLGLYLDATQDWAFLDEQYPTVQKIYKALMVGTLHNIRVDAVDGLLTWSHPDVALTWMDVVVEGQPITPRMGKAIEINALWYSSLCWARQWAEQLQSMAMEHGNDEKVKTFARQIQRYEWQINHVRNSLKIFWNSQRGYFYDTIGPDDSPDPSIRPNGIIALSLAHCGFSESHAQQALNLAHDRLLTPYGLRSLDPASADYKGHYAGNMTYRDRAYHQGTVWSWLIGPFIRAWKRFYGDRPVPFNAASLLSHIENQACLGSVSEIFDGEAPHSPQGTVSQAWSVAELIRHWDDLF